LVRKDKEMTKKNSTFEVTDDFLSGTEAAQDKAVRAFIAANPGSVITPKEEGQSLPYLRRQSGKRFNIGEALCTGGIARDVLVYARTLGGGERDIAAALAGGFSRNSKFYGNSFVSLSVSS
tara:strand:+ start:380 stop:742 length:363 start_codon:yes stop_codon:yes gene_type:complete